MASQVGARAVASAVACCRMAGNSCKAQPDALPCVSQPQCFRAPLQTAGREHLLFYARIKNMKGRQLRRAVDDALRSVNLFSVGDDLVGGYRWVRLAPPLWFAVLALSCPALHWHWPSACPPCLLACPGAHAMPRLPPAAAAV
jgi:hypothetical protein